MPLHMQGKLLRLIEDGFFLRVGGETPVPFRARVVSATHQDLDVATAAGRFREDLLFRLAVPDHYPAAPGAPEDIVWLLDASSRPPSQRPGVLRASARWPRSLSLLTWPGNVRELRNRVDRAVALAQAQMICPATCSPSSSLSPHPRKVLRRCMMFATLPSAARSSARSNRLAAGDRGGPPARHLAYDALGEDAAPWPCRPGAFGILNLRPCSMFGFPNADTVVRGVPQSIISARPAAWHWGFILLARVPRKNAREERHALQKLVDVGRRQFLRGGAARGPARHRLSDQASAARGCSGRIPFQQAWPTLPT